jgi:hypothetical protein
MVREKLVTVYNGYVSAGSFLIQTSDIKAEYLNAFKPVEVIYSAALGQLVLLAQVGGSDSQVNLAAFAIDHKTYESTFLGQITVKPFTSTSRTKTNVILHRDGHSQAINVFNLEASQDVHGHVLQTTTNNDFVFVQIDNHIHVNDVGAFDSKVAQFAVEKGCVAQRARENEASNIVKHTDAILSLQCHGH